MTRDNEAKRGLNLKGVGIGLILCGLGILIVHQHPAGFTKHEVIGALLAGLLAIPILGALGKPRTCTRDEEASNGRNENERLGK